MPMPEAPPAPLGRRWSERIGAASGRVRFALALGAGGLAGLGQVPFSLVPLSLLGFALGCLLLLSAPSLGAATVAGWAVGAGYFAITLFWIVEPFFVDAARHAWMAPFALVFLAGGLALFWAVAFAAARLLAPGDERRQAMAFAVAVALAELARSYVLTGFPWALPAYVWTETTQRGWAAVVGPHGLSFLTLALSALVALVLAAPPRPMAWRRLSAAAAGFALFLGLGPLFLPAPVVDGSGRPVVRLVQPNAPQHEKWDPEKAVGFVRRQIEFTGAPAAPGQARPDLIVWPETAIPYLLEQADPVLRDIAAASGGTPVVIGVQRRAAGLAYNSLAVIGAGGAISAIYDKHHLVPFGEYIPLGQLSTLVGMRSYAARDGYGYSPGPGPQLLDLGPLGVALPLICYEAIFPQDLAGAPGRAEFLLQITNDAWFGEFSGPYQHLAQARMRAVEQNLPMVRVANTGVSAMIDPAGRVMAEIPLGEAGWVDVALPPGGAPTIYVRTGDWAALAGLLGLLALLAATRKTGGARNRH
jgi:apolipoprotein N-acyltransferase